MLHRSRHHIVLGLEYIRAFVLVEENVRTCVAQVHRTDTRAAWRLQPTQCCKNSRTSREYTILVYRQLHRGGPMWQRPVLHYLRPRDRKSTRLNSSHVSISYAVFCL